MKVMLPSDPGPAASEAEALEPPPSQTNYEGLGGWLVEVDAPDADGDIFVGTESCLRQS